MKTKFTESQIETIAKNAYRRIVQSMREMDIPVVEQGYNRSFDGDPMIGGSYSYHSEFVVPDFESHKRAIRLVCLPEYDVQIKKISGKDPKGGYVLSENREINFLSHDFPAVNTYDDALERLNHKFPQLELDEIVVEGKNKFLPISFTLRLTGKEYDSIRTRESQRPLYREQSKFEKYVKSMFKEE